MLMTLQEVCPLLPQSLLISTLLVMLMNLQEVCPPPQQSPCQSAHHLPCWWTYKGCARFCHKVPINQPTISYADELTGGVPSSASKSSSISPSGVMAPPLKAPPSPSLASSETNSCPSFQLFFHNSTQVYSRTLCCILTMLFTFACKVGSQYCIVKNKEGKEDHTAPHPHPQKKKKKRKKEEKHKNKRERKGGRKREKEWERETCGVCVCVCVCEKITQQTLD